MDDEKDEIKLELIERARGAEAPWDGECAREGSPTTLCFMSNVQNVRMSNVRGSLLMALRK
jgi:hypothetical protein